MGAAGFVKSKNIRGVLKEREEFWVLNPLKPPEPGASLVVILLTTPVIFEGRRGKIHGHVS